MGVFPWILYRSGVGKVDCKNVPSLSLFPVAISPLNAFLHLSSSTPAIWAWSWDLLWSVGCGISNIGPAPTRGLQEPCTFLLPVLEPCYHLKCEPGPSAGGWKSDGAEKSHPSQGQPRQDRTQLICWLTSNAVIILSVQISRTTHVTC